MAAGSRKVSIDFVADIAKAERSIERLQKKITTLQQTQRAESAGTFMTRNLSKLQPGGSWGPTGSLNPASANLKFIENIGKDTAKKMSFFGSMMEKINPKFVRFASSMGVLSPGIARVTSALGPLGIAAVGLTAVFLGLKKLFEATFEMGNLVEGAMLQMQQISGRSEKSTIEGLLKPAMKESLLTQFTPAQMLSATQMAVQYGIDPFKQGGHGLNKDTTAMKLISSMGSFRDSHGKAMGPERAIYAIARGDRRLLRPYGRDVQNAYEESKSAGKTGSGAFVDTFISKLGKIPYLMNMAEKQARTMAGEWSTISGFTEEFFFALSGAGEETGVVTLWSQVRDILKDVRVGGIQFMSAISPFVTEFGTFIGSILKFIWDSIKLIWSIIGPVLIPAFKIMVQLVRIIFEVGKAIASTFISLAKIIISVVSAPIKLLSSILGVSNGIKRITDGLSEFVTGLQVTFSLLEVFMEGVVQKIVIGIDLMIKKITEFFNLKGIKEFLKIGDVGKGSVLTKEEVELRDRVSKDRAKQVGTWQAGTERIKKQLGIGKEFGTDAATGTPFSLQAPSITNTTNIYTNPKYVPYSSPSDQSGSKSKIPWEY